MSEAVLSKTRIVLLAIVIASAYVVWGLLCSLQPPFFPTEAEKKGATPSQYGFVFGVYSLAAFISSPFFARYGGKIGPKILYNSGAFLQAICGLAFGFLTYITNLNAFLGIAYLLRAIAGMADVAAWGAVLAVLMTLFPTKVSKIMAWTEMFFGLGYMIGPALGSFLFSAGGFVLPFEVVGSVGLVVAIAMIFIIPNVQVKPETKESGTALTFTGLLKAPSILMPFVDNFVCFFGNGMIVSMLEPHLNSVGATVNQVGIVFLVQGGVFMFATFAAGIITDKVAYPTMLSIFGNAGLVVAFTFIGPLPFVPIDTSVSLATGCTALVGFSYAFVMVSTFTRAQAAAVRNGFAQNTETYHLISGMWTSSLYLGNFFGPTIAGFAVEAWDFRTACLIYWSAYLIVLVVDFLELGYNIKKRRFSKNIEYTQIE